MNPRLIFLNKNYAADKTAVNWQTDDSNQARKI